MVGFYREAMENNQSGEGGDSGNARTNLFQMSSLHTSVFTCLSRCVNVRKNEMIHTNRNLLGFCLAPLMSIKPH